MKKKILLTSAAIVTFASVNLVVSCNYEEKSKEPNFPKTPEEQKYDELFSKYKEKYVGTDNYVFDDFEEFDFNNINHYQIVNAKKLVELNPVFQIKNIKIENNQNIYLFFTKESEEKFYTWFNDFEFKYKVYKDVIDKLAPEKKIKYLNNKDVYLVKESNYNFTLSKTKDYYSEIMAVSYFVMNRLVQIPNVKIEGLFALTSAMTFGVNDEHSYFSSLDIKSNLTFGERGFRDHFKIFSIPKPKIEKLFPNMTKKEMEKFNVTAPNIKLLTTIDFELDSDNYLNDWYNIENDLSARENVETIANQYSENFFDYDLTFSRERKVQDYDVKTDEKREYIKKDSIHFILSRPLKIISTEGKNQKQN
ncbi:hypothetical protein [Mycoplasma sp. Z386]